MSLPVNTDHPRLYESLIQIIDAFEKTALESEQREGILAVANGPLTGMDAILASSEEALTAVRSSRTTEGQPQVAGAMSGEGAAAGLTTEPFGVNVEFDPNVDDANAERPRIPDAPTVGFSGGVNLDLDLFSLMGDSEGAKKVREAIQECLSCDLRMQFDWQLKPLNLLGPIQQMIDEINAVLDSFETQLDPLQAIEGFCRSMNDFSAICVPDWINMLMGLKLLIRKYLSLNLKFKFDWTTVLGPLLKLITEGIQQLINGIVSLVSAPLDCAIGVLKTFQELGSEIQSIAQDAQAIQQMTSKTTSDKAVGRMRGEDPADGLLRDISWKNLDVAGSGDTPVLGALNAETRGSNVRADDESARPSAAFSFGVGGRVGVNQGLGELMKDPSFRQEPFQFQMTKAIEEAKAYVKRLSEKINRAVDSLNKLVGGGLSLQLANIGSMLFVKDMISMVIVIVQLLSRHQNVKDWCEWFDNNPQSLQDLLSAQFTTGTLEVATAGSGQLAFTTGPYQRVVTTCVSSRNAQEQHALTQWIKDLRREV